MEINQARQNEISTNMIDKDKSTAPTTAPQKQDEQFGEVWKKIQGEYGAKAERPKEIKKTLGKDDFLKLMIVQMKNQDPTKPFNAEQMAGQMAQYASVEQLQNINSSVGKLQTSNQPLERLAMTNMIGKIVTVDRERFPHQEGQNDALAFTLPRDATSVKVSVLAENGDTLFEKEMGALKSGANSLSWDGLKTNKLPAKSGNYTFKVTAMDEKGSAIQTNPRTQGRVDGVSFEGQEPVFMVGNSKISLRNIIKVDNDLAAAQIPGAQPLATAPGVVSNSPSASVNSARFASPAYSPLNGAPAAQAGNAAVGGDAAPSFFTFEKGKGSMPLAPENAKALAGYQAQVAPAPASAAPPSGSIIEPKGFPNGLSSSKAEDAQDARARARAENEQFAARAKQMANAGPNSSSSSANSTKGGNQR